MRAHHIYLALIVMSWNIYSPVKELKKSDNYHIQILHTNIHLKGNTMFCSFLDNEGGV